MRLVSHLPNLPIRPTLVACCVILAVLSLACSFDFGITRVGTSADGSLIVQADNPQMERFHSADGGLTWQPVPDTSQNRRSPIAWGGATVSTPQGSYSINGADITRTHAGETETAYSAAYLSDAANRILQSRATSVVLTTSPQGITYDDRSGNVIIAMGSQGVLVGTSDGIWQRVAVHGYIPTDFSVSARMGLLRSLPAFWAMLMLFLTSFPALAIILAPCRRREGIAATAVVAVVTGAIHVLYQPSPDDLLADAMPILVAVVIAVTAGPTAGFLLHRWPANSSKRRVLSLLTVGFPTAWVALTVPRLGPWADGGVVPFAFLVLVALTLGFMAVKPYWENGEQWRVLLIAVAAMLVAAIAPTLLWLPYVISGAHAGWISVLAASAVAFNLFWHLKRRQHAELSDPAQASGTG